MIMFSGERTMRQAQTLNEAQLRRVLQYCRSRRHPVRDETIVLFSFYAGLRAKEIANLTWGMVLNSNNEINDSIHLTNNASKGKSGRIIPILDSS